MILYLFISETVQDKSPIDFICAVCLANLNFFTISQTGCLEWPLTCTQYCMWFC